MHLHFSFVFATTIIVASRALPQRNGNKCGDPNLQVPLQLPLLHSYNNRRHQQAAAVMVLLKATEKVQPQEQRSKHQQGKSVCVTTSAMATISESASS